jgi:hypothetical protein
VDYLHGASSSSLGSTMKRMPMQIEKHGLRHEFNELDHVYFSLNPSLNPCFSICTGINFMVETRLLDEALLSIMYASGQFTLIIFTREEGEVHAKVATRITVENGRACFILWSL